MHDLPQLSSVPMRGRGTRDSASDPRNSAAARGHPQKEEEGRESGKKKKEKKEAKKRRNARFASVLRFLIFNRVSAKSRISSSSFPFFFLPLPPSFLFSRRHMEPLSAGIKFTFPFDSYYVTFLPWSHAFTHTSHIFAHTHVIHALSSRVAEISAFGNSAGSRAICNR